jgi:DNA sulfur modification protein DndB
MSITRPVIKGQMGSITYYETTMRARELANSVRPAKESDTWASASIEERIQRDLNINRVKQTIVPYLAQHPDRFFGSFIILAEQGAVEFEALSDIVGELPAAYRKAVEKVGFITIDSGELIALDGQHRLMSIREVITSGANLGEYATQVGDDEMCVLIIEFENPTKTRRIFNKVNRHAKPTGRSDNIITSEDDGFAIVTRRLLDKDLASPLAAREINGQEVELVNWMSTTLAPRSLRLTTISAVYEIVSDILRFKEFENFSEKENPVAPPETEIDRAYDEVVVWWDRILQMPVFVDCLADLQLVPTIRFDTTDHRTLLLRPVGQQVLARGVVRALERAGDQLTMDEAFSRAGKVDWSANPGGMWRDVVVKPAGNMIARKEAIELGADLLAYLIGDEFTSDEDRQDLWVNWNKARGKDPFAELDDLPPEELPEDLPEPVA